jgi:hypothetical protein
MDHHVENRHPEKNRQGTIDEYRVLFDAATMRPGSPFQQAIHGGSPGIAEVFPPESWAHAPTSRMRVLRMSRKQMDELILKIEVLYQSGRYVEAESD